MLSVRLGDIRGNKITITVTVPFGGKAEVVLPYAPECIYEDIENPLFEAVENGICHVKAGEYEVVYEASEPLKKRYSIDSTMEELLNHPDIPRVSFSNGGSRYDPRILHMGFRLEMSRKHSQEKSNQTRHKCWIKHWQNSNREGCYGAYKA